MTYLRLILLVVIWPICTNPVQAQLFRKRPSPPPAPAAQRVPELVMMLRTDPDESKRNFAAEELREFDTQTYTEILPALIEASRNDPRSGVRMEAVTTLSKIRPITREAGLAIEHAASEDSNLRARVHARTTFWKYQLSGFSNSSPSMAAKRRTTEEPPLIGSSEPTPTEFGAGTTLTVTPAVRRPELPRPLPTGPTFSTAVPQKPRLVSRPAAETTVIEDDLPPLPTTPPAVTPPVTPPPVIAPPTIVAPPIAPPPVVVAPPTVVAPPLPPPPTSGPSLPAPPSTDPRPLPDAPPVIVPLP